MNGSWSGFRSSWSPNATVDAGLAALRTLAGSGIPVVSGQARDLLAQSSPDDLRVHYLSLGLLYERGPWQIHAEISRTTDVIDAASSKSMYVSVGRRFGDLTLFTMAGRILPAKPALVSPAWGPALTPLVGPVLAGQAQLLADAAVGALNIARTDQRSLSVGTRWDVTPRTAFKLQFDRFFVGSTGAGLWNGNNGSSGQANVVTATLDFIF